MKKYATKEAAEQAGAPEEDEESDEEMSDVASLSEEDEVSPLPRAGDLITKELPDDSPSVR